MKLHGSSAARSEGDSLDSHLFFRDGSAAGVARFPVARSTDHSRGAIMRETAVLDLARDEGAESFVVYGGLSSVAASPKARFTRVLVPGRHPPERPRCRQATLLYKPSTRAARIGGPEEGCPGDDARLGAVAKPEPEKKRQPAAPAERRILPMQLQTGDRITDETGEWEIIGRSYTTNAGKDVHVRVKKVGQPDVTGTRTWGAHERVSVRRAWPFHRPATTDWQPGR